MPEQTGMNRRAILLAIFAHPDDEVFRCGGTLALLAKLGVRVQVLTATRGQAGSCGEPPLCSQQELGGVREAELRCACQTLGILPPRLLDYQDSALAIANEEEAIAQIMAILCELQPQALLTWPLHGLSGHPDHVAVSRWTTRAFERAEAEGMLNPSALYYMAVPQSIAERLGLTRLQATPDDQVSLTVDVGAVWEQKLAAIACHRTQANETPILRAPLERQRLFLGMEHFLCAAMRAKQDVLSLWLSEAGVQSARLKAQTGRGRLAATP